MKLPSGSLDPMLQLLQLESELLKSDSMESFSFLLVNQLRRLVSYQQATLWIERSRKFQIEQGSGVSTPDQDAPYIQWLSRVVRHFRKQSPHRSLTLSQLQLPSSIMSESELHHPGELLLVPLWEGEQNLKAVLVLTRSESWSDEEKSILDRLAVAAGVVVGSHLRQRKWSEQFLEWFSNQSLRRIVVLLLLILPFLIPIRLSVLAPAEIAASDPVAVTAPLDGIVKSILVSPNQAVEEGDPLFQLDPKALQGQLKVEQEGVEVAQAELLQASQKIFQQGSGEEIQALRSRLRQHEARVEWIEMQLQQLLVRAPIAGVVTSSEIESWIGRPVVTGEKILVLANPSQIEVEMWISVEDLLPPSDERSVKLYLYRHGNDSVNAKLDQIGYRALLSPQGVLAYRANAKLMDQAENFRIGERGTARIYGPEATLFYYLFRKPIYWLRSWIG